MKKIEKIFLNIVTAVMIAEILLFLVPLAFATIDGYFDWGIVILALLLVPAYMILNIILLSIYEIVSPSNTIYWRIFRWVECAIYLVVLILIFTEAMHETPYFLSIIPFVMTITEIAVRLVIKHQNKKSIQETE